MGPGRGPEKLRTWQCRVRVPEGKGRVSSFLPEVKFPSWWQTGPRLLTTSGGEGWGALGRPTCQQSCSAGNLECGWLTCCPSPPPPAAAGPKDTKKEPALLPGPHFSRPEDRRDESSFSKWPPSPSLPHGPQIPVNWKEGSRMGSVGT